MNKYTMQFDDKYDDDRLRLPEAYSVMIGADETAHLTDVETVAVETYCDSKTMHNHHHYQQQQQQQQPATIVDVVVPLSDYYPAVACQNDEIVRKNITLGQQNGLVRANEERQCIEENKRKIKGIINTQEQIIDYANQIAQYQNLITEQYLVVPDDTSDKNSDKTTSMSRKGDSLTKEVGPMIGKLYDEVTYSNKNNGNGYAVSEYTSDSNYATSDYTVSEYKSVYE